MSRNPWHPTWPIIPNPPGMPGGWSNPDDQLANLIGRPGDIPKPDNNRWGKSQLLSTDPTRGKPSYAFVSVAEMLPFITPMAIQFAFSLDGVTFTPQVPAAYTGALVVTVLRAVDVKSGVFEEQFVLNPGDAMPFCTTIARGLTVNVELINEAAPDIFVHVAATPTSMVDCDSLIPANDSPWTDVETNRVPANSGGAFTALAADPATRQIFIQNNSAVDLLVGFGSLTPALGPPPVYNLILPGGFHGVYESQLGAFKGKVSAIFASGGVATDYAVFTRGIA